MVKPKPRPNRRAVSEWALERLYDLVFSGDLPAGAIIREEELTVQLRVSRSPIRESLRQLEADGLLSVDPATGRRRVARFGPDDVYELYTIRAGLEEISAAHAASEITADQLAELQRLQSQMDQTISDPLKRDFATDIAFHRYICQASGLRRLNITLSPIWAQSRALLQHLYAVGCYNDPDEDALACQDHGDIINALRQSDAQLAANLVRRHLHDRRDRLINMLDQYSPAITPQGAPVPPNLERRGCSHSQGPN